MSEFGEIMKATSLDKKIRKEGLSERLYFHRYRLSNDEYHGCTQAVSSTALKELYYGNNPQLCYQKYIKRALPFRQTEAMLIGAAAHKIILEPRSFKKEFAVWEGRKAGKAYDAFKLEFGDKSIITGQQYDDIRRMRDAVMRHKEAAKLLTGGNAEESVFWRDEQTGVLCRARCDYNKTQASGTKVLIDVKTCRSADPDKFVKEMINLGYPIQEAMYLEGFEADAFAFIAIEKGDFNTVEVYTLDDIFAECGHLMYREALQKWSEYRGKDHWPTYTDGKISELICPNWLEAKVIGA
jgi:exodeoxyribonuclease VIII